MTDSPFSDAFIVTLRKNIESVFGMIRKVAARQDAAEKENMARFKALADKVEHLEKALYNVGDAFALGANEDKAKRQSNG